MAATQMNIRIEDALKAEGDAVFAQIGYTPTRVVRTIWEYAAALRSKPEEVAAMLRQAERIVNPSPEEEAARRVKVVDEGLAIFPSFLEEMGIGELKPFQDGKSSAAEERERAAWERALEKGWVNE